MDVQTCKSAIFNDNLTQNNIPQAGKMKRQKRKIMKKIQKLLGRK
jgi:hypothetical protein